MELGQKIENPFAEVAKLLIECFEKEKVNNKEEKQQVLVKDEVAEEVRKGMRAKREDFRK